jgi:hypothetical protein
MEALTRRERVAVALWIVVSIVVGNTIYDLIMTRAIKEYMFRVALYQAGRGPLTSMPEVMDRNVYYATWISLLFASAVALAGFATIRLLRRPAPDASPLDRLGGRP